MAPLFSSLYGKGKIKKERREEGGKNDWIMCFIRTIRTKLLRKRKVIFSIA